MRCSVNWALIVRIEDDTSNRTGTISNRSGNTGTLTLTRLNSAQIYTMEDYLHMKCKRETVDSVRCAKGKLVARIALLLFTVNAMAVITYFDPVPLKGEMEIECIGYAQFSFFGKTVDDKRFGNRILEFDYACGFSMDGVKPGDHVRL